MPGGEVSKKIKDALKGLIQEPRDELKSTVEITRDLTSRALRSVRRKRPVAPQHIAEDVVMGAIRAGSEAGTELNSVAKGAVIGVTEGMDGVAEVNEGVVRGMAEAAVKSTSEVGGDVAKVARKVVEGAIEAGEHAGMKAEDAAYAAVDGILRATESIGGGATATVTKAVSGTISGIRIVLGVPHRKPVILAVDSNQSDLTLLAQHLEQEGYQMMGVASLTELDRAIASSKKIALALIDLTGFDQSVWEHCERLRKAKIPFVVISPQRSPCIQRDSMKCGASGLLVKPVGVKELMEYIHTLLGD